MSPPAVVLAMRGPDLRDALLPPALLARLASIADCDPDLVVTDFAQAPDALATAEVLLTGWGCPRVDAAALERMPRLRLVAHAAGTVKGHVDPVCWERGIQVTTAAAANAVPVVEFAVAQILLAGKDVLGAAARYRAGTPRPPQEGALLVGNYGRVVGIIGASTIGRGVLERLRTFDLELLLADPTITADEAERLGAQLVDLDALMARSDVVSLHAPLLPGTVGMVGAPQVAAMRDGTTFVNTARGRIVDHDALRRELRTGRISAMLDVTDPEPLEPDDELFGLPNVLLTPHIAGSMGNELHRMAALALDEIEHLATGTPLRHPVHLEDLARMA